jgi:hypothetical protein
MPEATVIGITANEVTYDGIGSKIHQRAATIRILRHLLTLSSFPGSKIYGTVTALKAVQASRKKALFDLIISPR